MAKIGDTVRFLNSVGGGVITRIDGNIAHVEDEDGFDVPVLLRECVVVQGPAKPQSSKQPKPAASATPPSKEVIIEQPQPEPELPIVETDTGNKLNILLAFEPIDIKKLSTTAFEATLVNDSNYYVSFMFATRRDDSEQWTLRRQGIVEPNIMLSLGQYGAEDINDLENIAFQYFAYKAADKEFELKEPGAIHHKVDTIKFCKLHCFRENPYFDEPVLAFDLVTDDKPYSPIRVATKTLETEMRRKKAIDRRPIARPIKKRHEKKNNIIEVDLHINELIDNTHGLSRSDMINLQIDEFRRVMEENLKNHGQKIVFIHGKGEGVLRQAILKELNYRYKGHDVCDASFREYGFGATQVTIR